MEKEKLKKVSELYKAIEKAKSKRMKLAIIVGFFVWVFGYIVLLTNNSLIFCKMWVMLAIFVSAFVSAGGLFYFNKTMLKFGIISFLIAFAIFIVQFIIL